MHRKLASRKIDRNTGCGFINGRGRVNSSNCVEVSTQIAHETEPNTKSTNQIILLQMADKTQSLTKFETSPAAWLDTV